MSMLVPFGQNLYVADGPTVSFFGFEIRPAWRSYDSPPARSGCGPLLR